MEYDSKKKEIKLNRELSNLDKLVLRFCKILEKYTDYVIISGYVSIILGRSRATEDVDLFIKKISLEQFKELYADLKRNGFWCLNAEKPEEIYSFLEDKMAPRFSLENKPIPNFEVKFPKRDIDNETFEDFITVNLKEGSIKISSLERQIAFKRYYLKSDKDIEDALHIEEIFGNRIDYQKNNGAPPLKSGVCKAPCFLDEGNFNEISCPENLAIFSDPKLKTVKLLPHSKECGFKFMDIIKLIN